LTTVAELLEALARSMPFSRADRSDPTGLQIGDARRSVRRVALCHEVTEGVVERIERVPVDLLISYHPLLYIPVRSLVAGPTPAGRALRLASAGVSLAVIHTCFDVAADGAAAALADALDLEAVEPFAPLAPQPSLKIVTFVPESAAESVLRAVAAAGAARVGNYTHCSFESRGHGTFFAPQGSNPAAGRIDALNREPEIRLEFVAPPALESQVRAALVAAHPYEEPAYDILERGAEAGMVGRVGRCAPGTRLADLGDRVKDALEVDPIRIAGDPDRELLRVAVVPGSGSEFRGAALAAGADVLVTGDWTHHRAREALDSGLAIIDPGHVATERPGLQRLFTRVASLARASVELLELDPDPWWS
jgi:dinuclear metal center YbgI/SA1388 family protein